MRPRLHLVDPKAPPFRRHLVGEPRDAGRYTLHPPTGVYRREATVRRIMMRTKIHRARVTRADPDYEGSITLDAELMEAADLLPYEQVHVLDIDSGARLVTYAIEGGRGTGEVGINGAAARLIGEGATVIVIAYGEWDDGEANRVDPRVVLVDEQNRPLAR